MDPETERISFKVLKADKAALRRLAEAEGEPMSVVVRRILRDELREEANSDHTAGRRAEDR